MGRHQRRFDDVEFDLGGRSRSGGMSAIVLATALGVGIGMLALWIDYRKKRDIFELHHKERMLAIERGMEVPPLPEALQWRMSDAPAHPVPFRKSAS